MNCIIVPPTPKAPNHYGAPNHHAWTGGNKCASSQAVWLIIVFLRLHRKKQIDSSWQNEFYICSICCGKSYFLSIYASQILRAAFSFECPGDLVNICVHLICPRQWVWPRKGPIALKPWLRPQDSPFFLPQEGTDSPFYPQFGKWTWFSTHTHTDTLSWLERAVFFSRKSWFLSLISCGILDKLFSLSKLTSWFTKPLLWSFGKSFFFL